jgi:hypothetical protein
MIPTSTIRDYLVRMSLASVTMAAYQSAGQQAVDRPAPEAPARARDGEDEVNLAAVAAYRASLESGTPLSERRLAAMFGKTSRRWARNRIAEARQVPASAGAEP